MPCCTKSDRGFSLLEVVLALAILAMSLALLGQLVSIGFQNAQQAQGLTEAQMIAETIMEEITLGIIPPDPVSDMYVSMTSDLSTPTTDQETPWQYSVAYEPAPVEGLMMVMVQVHRANAKAAIDNDTFELVRWIRDPSLATEELPESSSGEPAETGGAF